MRNVLFIMVDQMRADCMGVAGHPVVRTPHLDWLASRGILFSHAYVQTAVCGPSRMCTYTGRYTHAHRSYWNEVPLPLDEKTIAHYARAAGVRAALCGKTHHTPDTQFIRWLEERGFKPDPIDTTNAGFEPWEVNEFWGDGWMQHLKSQGYDLPFDNPMMAAFLVQTPDGRRMNGWRFEAARYPTVIREEDSDTAFMTRRAMEFIADAGEQPWLLHLSYLKPHWPNVAPAPYHNMYDPADVVPPVRDIGELDNPHPLLEPFRVERRSLPFDDEETWRQMRATYYGLITQIDDHLGRLFRFLEARGRMDDTLIIFMSDHGEYMGDHWLFEKEFFYESAIRIPLIIYDPDPRADDYRGQVVDHFVESIDIVPTCLDALEIPIPAAVQGHSLMPFLRGETPEQWRSAVYGDWDFRFYQASQQLGLEGDQCRAWMVRDRHYKYVHFAGLPDMLFDLRADPDELHNLAGDSEYKEVVEAYKTKLLEWRQRTEDNRRGQELEDRIGRTGVSWVPDELVWWE
ncbi:MAG: alkaline phosphatase family protein [Chloroflexota bacterium]